MFYEMAMRARTLTFQKIEIDWETSVASGTDSNGPFTITPVCSGGQIDSFAFRYPNSGAGFNVKAVDTSSVSAW